MVVAVVLVGVTVVVDVVEAAVLVDVLAFALTAGGRVALVLIVAFDFGTSVVVVVTGGLLP